MKQKTIPAVLVTVAVAVVGVSAAWYHTRAAVAPVVFQTATAATGNLVTSVACTGTLNAVTTVDVGSQVSGTIAALPVDFNSLVRKGQVMARLDTSALAAAMDQAKASLAKAESDLAEAQVAVVDATEKLDRQRALRDRELIPQSDLDDARIAKEDADAGVASATGERAAAKAAVDQAAVNLEHAVILAPTDGIVVARKVDVGQTIAAGFEAPSLFSLANDLSRMQLLATVDESDIARVAAGETARFSVDAYPNRRFEGKVSQVRLQPRVADNVVSYDVVIAVDNPSLLLRPGMTAEIAIETARHDSVVLVSAEALRFRPTDAVLDATGSGRPRDLVPIRATTALKPGTDGEVWVVAGGRIVPQRVTVGLSDGRDVEITGGLAPGTRVVSNAALRSRS